ncbi:MAG: hypothetical protein HY042_09790 [Spirochaetia bacterium]|nr:hypothetical protein [Spirochaetia bacterium]
MLHNIHACRLRAVALFTLFFAAALVYTSPLGAQETKDNKPDKKPVKQETPKPVKKPVKQETPKPDNKPRKPDAAKPDTKATKQGDTTTGGTADTRNTSSAGSGGADDPGFPRRNEPFRLRFLLGGGYGKISPVILNEAGPAWETNSFIRASQDGTSQPAVQIEKGRQLTEGSYNWGAELTYKDRLTFGWNRYFIDKRYDKSSPGKITFAEPGNTNYTSAVFEGMRLIRYQEHRDNFELMYLHPIGSKGIKLGGFLAKENYIEDIRISMGSYTLTRATAPQPDLASWSEGGSIPGKYTESGTVFGPAVRYQLFEWLGFTYKMTLLHRTGNFQLAGGQLLNGVPGTGAAFQSVLLPVHFAELEDKGIRHTLEGVLRFYCRYSLHVGILKEDYKRSYSSYAGNTLANVGNFSAKTQTGLGFGEMASAHPYHKFEVYVRGGVSVFF